MKKIYGISSLDTKALENNEFFQLLSESKDELGTFTKANKSEQVYATKLGDMEKLLETLQAGLHRSKASQTVASLEASDRERDDALSILTGLVKAFSRVKEASSKEAYDKLSKLFKNYAGLTSMSYEKETEAINHLLKELKDSDYQTALSTLHLTTHVETLTKAQAQFEKAYKERLAEQKGKHLVKTRKSVRNYKKSMTSLWTLLQSTPMLIQIKSSMSISVTISTLSVVAIKKASQLRRREKKRRRATRI